MSNLVQGKHQSGQTSFGQKSVQLDQFWSKIGPAGPVVVKTGPAGPFLASKTSLAQPKSARGLPNQFSGLV